MKGSDVMATGHSTHVHVKPADDADPALSDEDKAKAAEDEAVAAAEVKKDAPHARFVEYVVPRRATASYVDEKGKRRPIVTRPSGEPHAHASVADDGSYSSRVGVANARATISVQDWARVGISATEKVVWDFGNNWRVTAKKFTDEQLDFLFGEDRRINGVRFELVDGNGNKVDR